MLTATRFPSHTPDTAQGRAADRLGELWNRHDGRVSAMVRTMAGSSAMIDAYLDFSRAMKRSRLPRTVAEQISIAVQARLGCATCLEAHIAAGVAAGLTDHDIAHAIRGTATEPATAAILSYALAVHTDPGSIDDDTLAQLRAHGHRDRDLLDVIGLVTLNHLTGTVNLVAGLEPEDPMNTTTRLAAYGGILAASFAGAAGLGVAAGPIDTGSTGEHGATAGHGGAEAPSAGTAIARAGTSLDAAGIRLVADTDAVSSDAPAVYSFRLVDQRGAVVTEFSTRHERDLHLIVASRDLETYHHLHPEHDGTGTWTVELPPLGAGWYRVFADGQPATTEAVTLGVDLLVVEGALHPGASPGHTTSTVGGFDVALGGEPVVGSSALTFVVSRNGESIGTEPYLGAAGHLVVLRAGDLAYVHAHAEHELAGEPSIPFDVSFPTAGTYRLFLDFSVDGAVHTADFTVQVPDRDTTEPAPSHEGH